MSLLEQIDTDIIQALKGGDKDRLTVLRGLKSDFKYKQISVGEELTDEKAVEVLSSAAKRRRDSIEQFRRGGRDDLVRQEEFELDVITAYLPKQLTEDELRQMARSAIEEVGAESTRQIGLVMKVLMPKVKGVLAKQSGSELLANIQDNGQINLEIEGQQIALTAEEVEFRIQAKPGWTSANDKGEGFAHLRT